MQLCTKQFSKVLSALKYWYYWGLGDADPCRPPLGTSLIALATIEEVHGNTDTSWTSDLLR